MNNLKKGVSLISLIITILVILILASIAIFSSLGTVEQSQIVKAEAEFKEVATFVRTISSLTESDLMELTLTNATKATPEQIQSFLVEGENTMFTSSDCATITGYNQERSDPNKCYHFVRGADIQNDTIPGMENLTSGNFNFTIPNKVENNYIINFYYGVIIGNIAPDRTLKEGSIR